MADGGISEAAIAAAVAESAAAAEAAAAAGTAATLAAAGTTAATAAETAGAVGATAAAAAPEIAAAATVPELALATAPEVATAAAPAIADAPFLGATASEPLLGPTVAAPEAVTTTVPSASLLGEAPSAVAPTAAETAPSGLHSAAWEAGTGPFAEQTAPYSPGLLDQLGDWWQTASTGDKLSAGGKLLSGIGTAGSAASAAKGTPSKGPTHTIQPGQVGRPTGGEAQLAAIVDAMLKKKDAYQQGLLGGQPVTYRPRSLLG